MASETLKSPVNHVVYGGAMSRTDGAGLRPIDLARTAGLSTQQIRNYADAGILPAAQRTRSGYRMLHTGHRAALETYRVLARGHGVPSARAIMQAVHAEDVPNALALADSCHAALHEERRSLEAAGEALEAVAQQPPEAWELPRSGTLRIGEVAARLGVRTSALRVWESAGLLAPRRERGTAYRSFSPSDVRDAQLVRMLRQGRYPLPQIRSILDGLHRTGGSSALREAMTERRAALTRRSAAILEGAAQLHRYLGEFTDGYGSEHGDEHRSRPLEAADSADTGGS